MLLDRRKGRLTFIDPKQLLCVGINHVSQVVMFLQIVCNAVLSVDSGYPQIKRAGKSVVKSS